MDSQPPGRNGAAQVPGWSGFGPDAMAQWQQAVQDGWQRALGAMQQAGPAASVPSLGFAADKLEAARQQYLQEAASLWNGAADAPAPDKRLAGEAWQGNAAARFAARAYSLNTRTLLALADAVEGDAKTRGRIRFAVEQWAAALSPANSLATNPDAQRRAVETGGRSIAQGVQNLLADLRQGHMSQTDESQFEVGRNVATTPGHVVFENALFQLIEYTPTTPTVHALPLLLVPPCINKFYILDLQPENSLIAYAVSQGHRTFVVSWRNPDDSLAGKTWDDYIEHAAIRAIDVVQDITQQARINTLGFCVGGTILATALAVLAARGERPAASATLLTTFLDFSDTGVLDLFIDEQMVQLREMQLGQGGLLKGQELASTFSFLRPNELVWNYVAGNYLQGDTPPPFDLLYWNSDSTNLPGPFYTWYLRNTYLENKLVQPGAARVCGVGVDLGLLGDTPFYIYGSREDHIVPVGLQGGGAYASTRCLPGPKRFVMGASGHIAGVINPPAKNKRSHWTRDDGQFPPALADWLAGATEHKGSWWPDWAAWLGTHAGAQVPAPTAAGCAEHPPTEPAPGRYVRARA